VLLGELTVNNNEASKSKKYDIIGFTKQSYKKAEKLLLQKIILFS
jgi:hypothetical protein